MILRSGVDLIEIDRLASLNPRIRHRFLKRVYTERELAFCGESDARLAGRFAAKEAVAKTLGTGIGPVRWQDIEICNGTQGEPQLQLHGAAREIAASLGLHTWSISISHTVSHALAMCVALGDSPDAKADRP